jgi:hypothetical protein
MILNILFFLFLFISALLIILRPNLYDRPTGYFIAITLLTVILSVEILFLPQNEIYRIFVLFKIIIFSFGLICVPQFIYQELIGVDPWYHQMVVASIIKNGVIPAGTNYSLTPIFQLLITNISLLTHLNYMFATIASMFMFTVIALGFIFLIGRSLFNSKVGLLGALLLGTGVQWMAYGTGPIPQNLGLILISILIYLVLVKKQVNLIYTYLTMVVMLVLILSHALSASCLAIILFCFLEGFLLYGILNLKKVGLALILYFFLFFTVAMFGWWIYFSNQSSILKQLIQSDFHISAWKTSDAYAQYMLTVPYSEYFLDLLGFLVFIAFSIVGSFYMLSKKFGSKETFALVIGGLSILLISFITLPLGLTGFLAQRWWYYAYLVLAIPAAIGVFSICRCFSSKIIRTIVMSVLIFILAFFSFTSPEVNYDNRIYNKNTGDRYALTKSEISDFGAIADIWDGTVGVVSAPDYYFFSYNQHMNVKDISSNLFNQDFSGLNNVLVIIDNEILTDIPDVAGGLYRLNYDPRSALERDGFICIYQGADTSAYLKQ